MKRFFQLLLILSSWQLLAAPARAAESVFDAVEVGIAGHFKVGYWTPVGITIKAGDKPVHGFIELIALDGDGLSTRYGSRDKEDAVDVAAHQTAVFTRYIKLGRTSDSFEIRLVDDKGVIESKTHPSSSANQGLLSTQRWVLICGSDLKLSAVRDNDEAERLAMVTSYTKSAHDLPFQWFGYDGVTTLFLVTSNKETIDQISQEQVKALDDWVKLGGRLVIFVGRNGSQLAEGKSPLSVFAPGPIQKVVTQQDTRGLETYAHAAKQLPPFQFTVVEKAKGQVEATVEGRGNLSQPAIIRSPRGFGQILFVAFDIDQPPFVGWEPTVEIYKALLRDHPESAAASNKVASRRVRHRSYDELTGQLRSALDYFPSSEKKSGVLVVSFFSVAFLLFVYLAWISAGDYFFLNKLVKRMEWTWITFPLVVIGFCALIYYLGHQWRGGSLVRLNQVDVIDIDLMEGAMRGVTWANVFSSRTSGYDLSYSPHLAVQEKQAAKEEGALVSWQGLPGGGLGGFDKPAETDQADGLYLIRNNAAAPPSTYVNELPIVSGGTKSLIARWWRFQSFEPPYVLSVDRDGILHGDVRNPLNVALEDAMIVHDRWVYRIDREMRPGESLNMQTLQRRDLEWRLTRRRVQQAKTSYTTTPWEPDSRDVPRIMEVMMFHQASGGAAYTELTQQYQSFLDLSKHLQLGRAILVGRVAEPGAILSRDHQSLTEQADRRYTWYRIVLPVQDAHSLTVEGTPP